MIPRITTMRYPAALTFLAWSCLAISKARTARPRMMSTTTANPPDDPEPRSLYGFRRRLSPPYGPTLTAVTTRCGPTPTSSGTRSVALRALGLQRLPGVVGKPVNLTSLGIVRLDVRSLAIHPPRSLKATYIATPGIPGLEAIDPSQGYNAARDW